MDALGRNMPDPSAAPLRTRRGRWLRTPLLRRRILRGGFGARAPILLCALALAVPACDDGDDLLVPDIRVDATGFWKGETADGREVRLILTDERDKVRDHRSRVGVVEGSGTIVGPDTSLAVVAEGTNVSGHGGTIATPDLSLTLKANDPSDGTILINYQARFVGTDRMQGRLNGGGFTEEPLTLRKQVDFDD